jgi:hypothetical protein
MGHGGWTHTLGVMHGPWTLAMAGGHGPWHGSPYIELGSLL